ncbi:hypothetical protein [Ketogulonicigenium vulgare]|uniref:hypothetical protein n=1 Tax=Ketogulonicigenium vulgare TaxID=92945 RepID=UPI0005C75FE0|nr:hypothetical protein [Ketogulonicigenium vulgare]
MAAKKPQMPRYDAVFRGDEARVSLAKLLWKEVIAALEEVSALSRVNLARADRYVRAKVEFEALYPGGGRGGPGDARAERGRGVQFYLVGRREVE